LILEDHRSSAQRTGLQIPTSEGNYEDDAHNTIKNILAQLGLADVKAFGSEYQDCEEIMQKLGYTLEVKALSVA